MRNLVKNKKKKGFTLIEMVAVIAIIGILAAVLVPKVAEYMRDAKRTKIITQARTITQAVETARTKEHVIAGTLTIADLDKIAGGSGVTGGISAAAQKSVYAFLEIPNGKTAVASVDKLKSGMTLDVCKQIADGVFKDFIIDDSTGAYNDKLQ